MNKDEEGKEESGFVVVVRLCVRQSSLRMGTKRTSALLPLHQLFMTEGQIIPAADSAFVVW